MEELKKKNEKSPGKDKLNSKLSKHEEDSFHERILKKTKLRGLKSARELYRQSGRRRSAKLVPTFADRGVSRGQRNGSPQPLISVF